MRAANNFNVSNLVLQNCNLEGFEIWRKYLTRSCGVRFVRIRMTLTRYHFIQNHLFPLLSSLVIDLKIRMNSLVKKKTFNKIKVPKVFYFFLRDFFFLINKPEAILFRTLTEVLRVIYRDAKNFSISGENVRFLPPNLQRIDQVIQTLNQQSSAC